MARTASAQSVQTQSSTRRTHFFGPKSLKYLKILLNSLSHTILVAFNYFSSFTLGWLIFVTGTDLLWLVSPRIQQPNKCCMARTASAQSVQAQSSTRRTHFFGPKSLKYLNILLNSLSHTILVAFNYFSSLTLDMKLVHSKAVYIVFQSFT